MKILKIGIIVLSLSLIHCGGAQNSANFGAAPASRESERCGGSGTKEDPFLICTVQQFKAINGEGDRRYFKLTTDLDFSDEKDLKMIAIAPFASIDGDNHKLKNITLHHTSTLQGGGLYGQLTWGPNGTRDEIRNLIIEDVKVIGYGGNDSAGVIAAANWDGLISNVHVTGTVEIEGQSSSPIGVLYAGGLVGINRSIIEDSSFEGIVSGVYNVGLLAGINGGILRNSKASGIASGLKGVGGAIGVQLKPGCLPNSSASAAVIGKEHFGDQIGFNCNFEDYYQCGIDK